MTTHRRLPTSLVLASALWLSPACAPAPEGGAGIQGGDEHDALLPPQMDARPETEGARASPLTPPLSHFDVESLPALSARQLLTLERWSPSEAAGDVSLPLPSDDPVKLVRCIATSQAALRVSAVAYTGCPAGAANSALGWAWVAAAEASACAVRGESCDGASYAAASSALWWTSLVGSCPQADVAAAAEASAWWACGPYLGEEEPSPTEAPATPTVPESTPICTDLCP